MKQIKVQENLSEGHDKGIANNWKNKAISRGKQNNFLRKVGKFYSKIKANNRTGLTESVFTIANFSQPFSENEAKNALEKVKLKDVILIKKRA